MDTLTEQELFKMLCELSGKNVTHVATAAGVQRTNIYTWLKAQRKQVISQAGVESMFAALGTLNKKLSPKFVHCWHVDEDLRSTRLVLKALVDPKYLEDMQIYFIDTDVDESFNIIRIPGNEVIIMVSWARLKMGRYPLSTERLGFGIDQGHILIPWRKWNEWTSKSSLLLAEEFWSSARHYFDHEGSASLADMSTASFVDIQKNYESEIANLNAINSGLCAVIRSLLSEVRKLDPENPLLERSNRDWEFNQYYQQELRKLEERSTKARQIDVAPSAE